MANWGRPKIKVYVYDSSDCSYIRTFDTISDFRNHYWPNDIGKRPVFQKKELGCDYEIIEDVSIIALTCRPGREAIRLILNIDSSEYCKAQDRFDNIPVQVFNLRGDLIAEFASQRLAGLLCASDKTLINHHLKRDAKVKPKKVFPGGLIFKYKK